MPAKSKAQLRWVNSPAGHKALGSKGVQEWNQSSKGRKFPERARPKSKPRRLRLPPPPPPRR